MRRGFARSVLLALMLMAMASGLVRAQGPTPTPLGGGLAIGGTAPAGPNLAIGGPAGTPSAGVSGSRYLSPTYGFRLSWDATWRVAASSSAAGEDRLGLTNGTTTIDFDAHAGFGGDPAACLQAQVQALQAEPGVTEVQLAADANGQPLQGGGPGQAFAVYTETVTAATGAKSAVAAYLECRSLVPGSAVLVIVAAALRTNFNAQIPTVQVLLATLSLPAAAAGAAAVPTSAAAATAACQGMDAWVAATIKDISSMLALETEMKTPQADVFAADGRWASLLAALAQTQGALPAPPAAAKANADLAQVFQQASDLLTKFVAALTAGDAAGETAAVQQFAQVDAAFGSAQGEAQAAAQQCGAPFKLPAA